MTYFLINVGSNTQMKGRAPIDPNDLTFEYWPFNEQGNVHHDPEFETYTYGHVKRGYGHERMLELGEGEKLYFYATLENKEDSNWIAGIIGYLELELGFVTKQLEAPNKCLESAKNSEVWKVIDGKVSEYVNREYSDRMWKNPHLNGAPSPDILVVGSENSEKFDRAVPLTNFGSGSQRELKEKFRSIIRKPGRGNNKKIDKFSMNWCLKIPTNFEQEFEKIISGYK